MKRSLLAIFISLVLLCCLFSCAQNTADDETSGNSQITTETTAPATEETTDNTSNEPLPSIDELVLSDYKIVIPNKSPTSFINIAKKLSTGIKTETGTSITYMSDVLIGETGPVILLGDTKYPESAHAKELLTKDYSFVIKVFEGGRIAICATEDGVLQEAVEYFIENCISGDSNSLLLNDSSSINRCIDLDGVEDSILLSINGLTKYGIVYPESADYRTKSIIERFAGKVAEKTGANVEIFNDSTKSADFEIVVGDTKRSNTDTLAANSSTWKISADGTKIFINGSTTPIMADALNEFVTKHIQVDDEFAYVSKSISDTDSLTEYDREGWEIAAPAYEGGTLAAKAYNSSTGRYNGNSTNESTMELVSATNAGDFNSYLTKLEANGYELVTKTTIDDNIYAQYEKGYSLIYAYYTHCYGEARIIDDCASVSEDEFEYAYDIKSGETVDVIQYGIMSTCNQAWPTNGMFYIIKLADNSVVLIDGGNGNQATNAAVDGVYQYLKKITGVGEDEKIRIAALYYTHPHGDHVNMSPKLVSRHGDKLEIERVMCNFPSENAPLNNDSWSGTIVSFLGTLASKYPNVKMIQLHTGQQIELGGAEFTVLYTQEDTIDAETATASFTATNNYSTVLALEANGVKTIFLGDFGNKASEREIAMDLLLDPYSDETLKCDVVQVAHHGLNLLERAYQRLGAKYALFSTADVKDLKNLGSSRKSTYNSLLNTGAEADTIFFQGRKTWNLSMRSGALTVTYEDITGVDDGYMEHLASCEAYAYSVTYGKTFE